MPNLSWLYYKGYHEGFSDWEHIGGKDKVIIKRISDFYNRKNQVFFDFALPEKSLSEQPLSGMQVLLQTQYPGLLFGAGYMHETGAVGETKMGFQLDHTTGLPIIPGSSVKGGIRAAFPQFSYPDSKPWQIRNIAEENDIKKEKAKYIGSVLKLDEGMDSFYTIIHQVEMNIFEGLNIEKSKAADKGIYYSIYKRDIFLDAKPIAGGKNKKLFGPDSITPHTQGPLKDPIPLLFMKVLPKVTYDFGFILSVESFMGINAATRKSLFTDLIVMLGLGAKTNVGYGQFSSPSATY